MKENTPIGWGHRILSRKVDGCGTTPSDLWNNSCGALATQIVGPQRMIACGGTLVFMELKIILALELIIHCVKLTWKSFKIHKLARWLSKN